MSQSGFNNNFQQLVHNIRSLLGSNGIDSEHVKNAVLNLMRNYNSNESDWKEVIEFWFKDDEPYVRHLVDNGNGKYNLVS
jgi:cysteine dioxygenase type I